VVARQLLEQPADGIRLFPAPVEPSQAHDDAPSERLRTRVTPARAIVDLSALVLAIAAVIFIVVATPLVYAIVRFHATSATADRVPAQV
jgi:heme/copper-type cytochrome/quinol oxidase subunit 2